MLVSAPDSTSGTRFWREPSADMALHNYNALVLAILHRPLPNAAKENGGGVAPRVIGPSDTVRRTATSGCAIRCIVTLRFGRMLVPSFARTRLIGSPSHRERHTGRRAQLGLLRHAVAADELTALA
jgi:hypothetical protein